MEVHSFPIPLKLDDTWVYNIIQITNGRRHCATRDWVRTTKTMGGSPLPHPFNSWMTLEYNYLKTWNKTMRNNQTITMGVHPSLPPPFPSFKLDDVWMQLSKHVEENNVQQGSKFSQTITIETIPLPLPNHHAWVTHSQTSGKRIHLGEYFGWVSDIFFLSLSASINLMIAGVNSKETLFLSLAMILRWNYNDRTYCLSTDLWKFVVRDVKSKEWNSYKISALILILGICRARCLTL